MLDQKTHAAAIGDDLEGLLREVFVAICELPVPEGLTETVDRLEAAVTVDGVVSNRAIGDSSVGEDFSSETAARP